MLLDPISKKTLFSVFFIACLFTVTPAVHALPASCPATSIIQHKDIQSDLVEWIPDGDTIHTKNGSRIRLLNIDTPEINPTTDKLAEPFAESAKKSLENLIGSSDRIYWLTDNKKKDRYKRTLAHVFNDKGELLSGKLLEQGLAKMLVIPPNDGFWQCLKQLEGKANRKKVGIWSITKNNEKPATQAKVNQGYQYLTGKISKRYDSKKNRWFVLNDHLWVGISKKRFRFFEPAFLDKTVGDTISLYGYVYQSHGKLRVKLKHPAMLY